MSEWEKQVRKALIDKDMTISDLASELQISVSYLYEILKGTRKSDEQKQRIKNLLGLDINNVDE